jgi:YVTN family beta-propeller protein
MGAVACVDDHVTEHAGTMVRLRCRNQLGVWRRGDRVRMLAKNGLRVCFALTALLTAVSCALSPTPSLTQNPLPSGSPTPSINTATPTVKVAPTATASDSELQFLSDIVLSPASQIGRGPCALAILGSRLYVANRETDNISVMESGKIVTVVPVGDAPSALAVDEKLSLAFVANEADGSLSILSGDTVTKTVETVKSPACLAVADGRLYVGGPGSNVVMVHDARTGEKLAAVVLPGSVGVMALAANPERQLLYASTYGNIQIVDLRSLTVVHTVTLDVYVTLAADFTTGRFFCAEYDSSNNAQYLVAFDALAEKELGRVQIGSDPSGMAVDSVHGRIYVANSNSNDLSVIDAQNLTSLATVTVGLRPSAVAISAENTVYVACFDANGVAVIDGKTVSLTRSVALCPAPEGMVVDEASGRVYAAMPGNNSVLVLEGDVKRLLPAGIHPSEVALSVDGTRLFVLNRVSGDLAVLQAQDGRMLARTAVGELPQGLVVAPDTGRVLASNLVLDPQGQNQVRVQELLSVFGGRPVKPAQVVVDGSKGLLFAVASNGVPGSNGGMVVYTLDLATGDRLDKSLGGISTTAIALDEVGERLYSVASRPPSYRLFVDDIASFGQVASLALPDYPAALAYNPSTHHLFVCLSPLFDSNPDAHAELLVLDSRGLGAVTHLTLPWPSFSSHHYTLAVDSKRNLVYVGDGQMASIHVVRDVELPPPPSPTTAATATPWPTLTPRP